RPDSLARAGDGSGVREIERKGRRPLLLVECGTGGAEAVVRFDRRGDIQSKAGIVEEAPRLAVGQVPVVLEMVLARDVEQACVGNRAIVEAEYVARPDVELQPPERVDLVRRDRPDHVVSDGEELQRLHGRAEELELERLIRAGAGVVAPGRN